MEIDTSIKQETLSGYEWYGNTGKRMTNVLCSDGKRRVATYTGEPDTVFSQPARVKVNGKTVGGFIWFDSLIYEEDWPDNIGVWKFTAYSYRKNGNLLPEWSGANKFRETA